MVNKRVHTAKNWTAAEAVQVIVEGKDFDSICNIMKRFPMFAYYAMRLNEAGVMMLSTLPEYFTARKINGYLAGTSESADADEVATDAELDDEGESYEKPSKEQPKKKRGRPSKKPVIVVDDDDDVPVKKPVKRGRKLSKCVEVGDAEDIDDEGESYEKPVKKSAKGKKIIDDDLDDFDFDD